MWVKPRGGGHTLWAIAWSGMACPPFVQQGCPRAERNERGGRVAIIHISTGPGFAGVSLFATAMVVWALCVETTTEHVSTGLWRICVAGIIGWIVMTIASLMNSSIYKTWGDLDTYHFLVAVVVSWAPIFSPVIAFYLVWPLERKG